MDGCRDGAPAWRFEIYQVFKIETGCMWLEHGNETPLYHKRLGIYSLTQGLLASKKGLCSMNLVS
jgi:hypothetical protein